MSESLTYTVAETATALGIGRTATYELIRRGTIPHLRIGRAIRIPKASLDSWVATNTNQARSTTR